MSVLSIIIPAYNTAKWIDSCLQSVVSQCDENGKRTEGLEILVIDDGSEDSTAEIAMDYASRDSRISVIRTPNCGISRARNAGIERANGDYFFFLDSDDMLLPGCLSLMLKAAEKYGPDIIISAQHLTGNASTDPMFRPLNSFSTEAKIYSPEKAVKRIFFQKSDLDTSVWNKLFHRHIFDKGFRFKEDYYFEDLELVYRLVLSSGGVAVLPQNTYYYRRHPESALGHWLPKRLDVLTIVDDIEKYLTENGPHSLLDSAYERTYSANFNIYCYSVALPGTVPESIATACWKQICRRRLKVLFMSESRFKSKAGAVLSLTGRGFFDFWLRRFPGRYRLHAINETKDNRKL